MATSLGDRLLMGKSMVNNQCLESANGDYNFALMKDGNLVLSEKTTQKVLWESKSGDRNSPPWRLTMTANGNLSLARRDTNVAWSSGTAGRGDKSSVLVVQDNGDVVINSGGNTIWNTNTGALQRKPRTKMDRLEAGQRLEKDQTLVSPNGKYTLKLSRDTGATLHGDGSILWSSPVGSYTDWDAKAKLELLENGDLILILSDQVKWSSNTKGRGNASSTFILQDDGNMVLSTDGKEVWSTNTKQQPIRRPTRLDRLQNGEGLLRGDCLTSPNKKYTFTLRSNGDLDIYKNNRHELWTCGRQGKWDGHRAVLTEYGNLVLYRTDGTECWSSGTGRSSPAIAVLIMQDDGNLVMTINGSQVWSTNTAYKLELGILETGHVLDPGEEITSPNKKCRLVFQKDGDFVLYYGGTKLWSTNTGFQEGAYTRITMWGHGDLIMEGPTWGKWWSESRRRFRGGTSTLTLRDEGLATIVQDNIMIWSSNPSMFSTQWEPLDLTPGQSESNTLSYGQYLTSGQMLTSTNKQFSFVLRPNDTFIIRRNSNNEVLWSAESSSASAVKLRIGWDSILTATNSSTKPVWQQKAARDTENATLILGNDGNLSLRSGFGEIRWQTETRYPATDNSTSSLAFGEGLLVDQYLVNGDWKLTINGSGDMLVTNTRTNKTTRYVMTRSIAPGSVKSMVTTSLRCIMLRNAQRESLWISEVQASGKQLIEKDKAHRFQLTSNGVGAVFIDGYADPVWSTEKLSQA